MKPGFSGYSGSLPVFAGQRPPHVPATDPALKQLFKIIPKTELHTHLSGSAPMPLIREFMRENGLDEVQIRRTSRLKNKYRDLDDFLATYYQVPAQVKTPEQFRRAAIGVIQEAAKENVRYLEIRSSILAKGNATPPEIINAIETGIRQGIEWVKQHRSYEMNVGFIVLAQRAGTPEQSLESAKLAVDFAKRPDSLIRGFDLAGSEGQHSVIKHAEALRYVKAHGMPLTVHAGETETSEGISGVDSIKAALSLGADRIGHGLQVMNDPQLLDEMIKKQVPFEVCPWSNLHISALPNYKSHPLPEMLKQGLNVNLSTDNRMMSKITLSQQLEQLYAQGLLTCWNQLKQLTTNGLRGAFISPFEAIPLHRQINAQFAHIERNYRNTINWFFCKPCKHPKSPHLQKPRIA